MRFYLLLPMLLGLNLMAQSDSYLIIKHRIKAKEVVLEEGAFVKVKTFKGEKIKGRMRVLSEQLIKVKHKVVPLTNIERIAVRKPSLAQLGAASFSMGVNLVFYGLQSSFRRGWKPLDESYAISLPFLGAGASLIAFSRPRYAKNWTFEGQMPGW